MTAHPYSSKVLNNVSPFRYGLFLRPSPELAEKALHAMTLVERQFGFHAAQAYPPHMTLVGQMALKVSEEELIGAVDAALAGQEPIAIHNGGLAIQFNSSIGYLVNELADGQPNLVLREFVRRLYAATEPLRVYPLELHKVGRAKPRHADDFKAHITVLGHDGADHPDLVPEVLEFLKALDVDGPQDYVAQYVTLYRFHSEYWPNRYWETQQWTVLRSWPLGA